MRMEKKEIKFILEWCKGCGICVSFCPEGVLALNNEGKVEVVHPGKCISCGMCELYCPDMVIEIEKTN